MLRRADDGFVAVVVSSRPSGAGGYCVAPSGLSLEQGYGMTASIHRHTSGSWYPGKLLASGKGQNGSRLKGRDDGP